MLLFDNPYSLWNRGDIIVVIITLVTSVLRLLRGKIFSQLSVHSRFLARGQMIIRSCQKPSRRIKDLLFCSTIGLRKSRQNCRVISSYQTNRSFPEAFLHTIKKKATNGPRFQTHSIYGKFARERWRNDTFCQPLNTIASKWRFDLHRWRVCKTRVLSSTRGCIDGSLSFAKQLPVSANANVLSSKLDCDILRARTLSCL